MIKFKVVDQTWKAYVRSERAHYKQFGDCHGIAFPEDRKIHIRRSSANLATIIHEIVHAYQSELSFWELQLDEDQVEEWFCELFAKYGETILKDAKIILGGIS